MFTKTLEAIRRPPHRQGRVSVNARKQARAARKSAGDTIVEVMIATAVIAAVLGGSYAIASRALRSGRIAQERIEALKLAEGQVERLKFESKVNGGFDATYRSSDYCLSADASGNTVKNHPNNPGSGLYHASCVSSFYKINISYVIVDHSVPNKFLGTYSITVIWDRIGGGREELIINYQL